MNTQKPTTTEIHPNFNHRITYYPNDPLDVYELVDGIEKVTDRANAVLCVLRSLCDENEGGVAEISQINPNIIFNALDSVVHDLKDIKAIGDALRANHKATAQGGIL